MPYKIFRVPLSNWAWAEDELNAFLRGHRVLKVERRFVDDGENSFWCFCVDYHEPRGGKEAFQGRPGKERIDYRELLGDQDFAIYAKLRDLRKQIAQEESIPVYLIFTNEQLAQMVCSKARSPAALAAIEGVGPARLEKCGARLLEFLVQQWGPDDAASGKAV
jgi:superfamily II DNA helicase RecQ